MKVDLSDLRVANRRGVSKAYGLIALSGHVHGAGSPPDTVSVNAGSASATLQGRDCVAVQDDGVSMLTVHLLSHLLPNGPIPVKIGMTWGDGSNAAFKEVNLDIDNSTPLGIEVSKDLGTHGTPTIFGRVVDSTLFPVSKWKSQSLV